MQLYYTDVFVLPLPTGHRFPMEKYARLRQTLLDLSRTGVAILVISEELEELFEISDRIAVLAAGKLSAAQPKAATNAESVGLQMSGLFNATAKPTESSHAPA